MNPSETGIMMFKGNENGSSLSRLRRILADRYGKGLELRQLTDVSEFLEDGHAVKGTDLHIPLRVRDAFLGTAVVPTGEELSHESRLQVSQVVRMVLEPVLYRDFLARCEDELKEGEATEVGVSNLRSLAGVEKTSKVLRSNVVRLHGRDGHTVKRAALTMHELTERWAFVPFSDLRESIRTETDLARLGAITIFVEDIGSLDEQARSLLLEYGSKPPTGPAPLIVAGGAPIDQELTLPAQDSLNLDRVPLDDRTLREVLGMMFLAAE